MVDVEKAFREFMMANTKENAQSNGVALSSFSIEAGKKLCKENEELKRKIEQLEAAVVAKTFDITHIKAIVEPFSGEGTMRVRTWFKQLEEAFRVLKLNKSQQLVAACALLIDTAAAFRNTMRFKDYDDCKAKLLEEFEVHECSDEDIMQKLRANKLKDDNVLRYVLEMNEMANGYNIAEVDLVDIIIDGLGDDSNVVVMLYGVKTIAELKSLLPRYKKRRFSSSKGNAGVQRSTAITFR